MDRKFIEAVAKHSGAPPAAESIALRFIDELARIKAQQFNAEREARETQRLRDETIVNLDVIKQAARAEVDARAAGRKEAAEAERFGRATERRQLGDLIDLVALRTSEDPAEIIRLAEDAAAHGSALGQEAKTIALVVLRKLHARPAHQHNINDPVFLAICRLSAGRASEPITREQIDAAAESEKQAIDSAIGQVAAALGLGDAFKLATVVATVVAPVRASGSIVVGEYWERLAAQQK